MFLVRSLKLKNINNMPHTSKKKNYKSSPGHKKQGFTECVEMQRLKGMSEKAAKTICLGKS